MTYFSVVITNYNHEKYIGKCISSVLNQTFKNFELIIIENNSSDNSMKIIKSFKDKRIKIFKINNGGIIAKSRNLGIKKSKSHWIAFLDSDDFWFKKKLEIVRKKILENKNNHIHTNNERYKFEKIKKYQSSRLNEKLNLDKKNFFQELILNGNKLSLSATVVNKNFLKKNNIFFREKRNFVTAEDYDFWLNLAKNGAKFNFIKEILGVYLIHTTNLSSNIDLHINNTLSVCKDHIYSKNNLFSNKDKIYQIVKFRLMIYLFRKKLAIKILSLVYFDLILLVIKHPLIAIKFIINMINKKNKIAK
jgi:glycosyltransferase involved in cell wall biosynthesis